MRVLFFWEPVGGLTLAHRCNPYAGLLARVLEPHGVTLELGDYAFQRAWLERRRADVDVLHFHWLHYLRRIAHLLGGEALCLEGPGGGCRFEVTIPFSRVAV